MPTDGKWSFAPLQPGRKLRESTVPDHFSSDQTGGAGAALVREGIQNALDAKASKDDPVWVRISFLVGDEAPLWHAVKPWLEDATDHYRADNGIRSDVLPAFSAQERCALLVFEDFYTTGLLGDPSAAFPQKQKNNFYHFWRAEGRTEKTKETLGSRGVGKDVYYRSSRLWTIFGLTIQNRGENPRPLLMGQTLLNLHSVGSGTPDSRYYQEGYWGSEFQGSDGIIVLPIDEPAVIDDFRQTFDLLRDGEPGLSVVVPYLDEDEITDRSVVRAIVQNYYYAIITNTLEVTVRLPGSGEDTALNAKSLLNELNTLEKADDLTQGEAALVRLAHWSVGQIEKDAEFEIAPPDRVDCLSKWGDLDLGSIMEPLRDTIAGNNSRMALRVPVNVRRKHAKAERSYFRIYLQHADGSHSHRPSFIRDGLMIPGVGTPPVRGVYALVVVEPGPLAEFLRLSENPSHTTWQKERVRRDYIYAPGTLRFVTHSVREILNHLATEDQAKDNTLLADIFPMSDPSKSKTGPGPPPPPPPLSPALREILITRRPGGFVLKPGPDLQRGNQRWKVRIAYDVRRGSLRKKLRHHTPTDFHVDRPPVSVTITGATREEAAGSSGNEIVFRDPDPSSFLMEVRGFDENRQIIVHFDKTEPAP